MIRATILILLAAAACVFAQSQGEENEGSKLEYDAANEIWRFKWWGKAGRTYFIQHSDDLTLWNWVPVVESGDDSLKEWGFSITGDRFFVRLRHTDVPTADPVNDDFDEDGIANLAEVMQGLNPFHTDSDGDGMPDGWEVANSLDPLLNDAALDPDGDGFSNLEEFLAGLDPQDPANGQTPASDSPEAPGRPEIYQAQGSSEAVITWEDRSDNELLFFIERCPGDQNWTRVGTVPANTTIFTDTGLDPDQVYFYRIVSRNNVPEP